MFRFAAAALAALVLAGCASAPPVPVANLDAVARDYVRLQMAIGEKEEGYIDAYYGPEDLKAEGQAIGKAEDLGQLSARVDALMAQVAADSAGLTGMDARRARFLQAQLVAAKTRLRMLRGEKLSFEDEALGLFGVRPKVQALSDFDPVLARIEKLLPGEGTLAQRVSAYQDRFIIPEAALRPVMDAAIAECKARTVRHIALPAGETFDLGFVTGKSWSGYNYYQGNYKSRIEVNTDQPVRISRAVDLGCHEGYPGHHVLNMLLEEKLVRGRGWTEFSVYPLYSPQSLIAEGSANFGIDLAFPGDEKAAFEKRVLYPLAGLPVGEAERFEALANAMHDLSGAQTAIARELIDGRITEDQAVALSQKYQLQSEARARQSVAFIKQYRSYVINYGYGRDLIEADVKAAGPGEDARWDRMEELLSEPTLPSDLRR